MSAIVHRHTGAILYEYDSGLSLRSALEKATAAKVNLYGANLRGANLRGANLYGANLRGADLRGANLRGANLYGANLRGANLGGANLGGANLGGANLGGAYLYGADLRGADLRGADLRGAYLGGANLGGANLGGAYLYGADLRGADLRGADLGEHGKLIGARPVIQIGPIGSRSDYLLAFLTDKGVVIKAGCFTGTLDEFRAAVAKTHGEKDHGREYEAAMLMIEAHAVIWTPGAEA